MGETGLCAPCDDLGGIVTMRLQGDYIDRSDLKAETAKDMHARRRQP